MSVLQNSTIWAETQKKKIIKTVCFVWVKFIFPKRVKEGMIQVFAIKSLNLYAFDLLT